MTEFILATVVQAGFLQKAGNVVVLLAVLGMAAFGFQNGLFLAVLYGLGGLATLFLAIGLGEPLAGLLASVDVPAAYALPTSIGLLAVGIAIGVRMAIGAAVAEDTLRFSPVIDKVGGVLMGGLAGMILGGTSLIALSAMPLPEPYRIDAAQTRYDLGGKMLRTFARFIEPDAAARHVLLEGEPSTGEATGTGVECSELFVDANGNGLFDGEGETAERHLDQDGSGGFTARAAFTDANGNGIRDIGLLERYRLGAWQNLRVLHHPTITSADLVELTAFLKDGQEVYKAVATDLDPGEEIVFAIRDPEYAAADSGPTLAIDAASGAVTITGVDQFMRDGKPATIVVVATDKQGLTDEKKVTIKYRGAKPRE